MDSFTGWQYLLIDVANYFGKDKLTFQERLAWATEKLPELETLENQAEVPTLYKKAVMALREAQAGSPTGHLVYLDAVCSGIQLMSALMGCHAGAKATGLIDTGKRPDAYREVADQMNQTLQQAGVQNLSIPRKDVKRAVMTSCYGSKRVPQDLFGKDSVELEHFYNACFTVAPGAFGLLDTLLASWQPYALEHSWTLPDGFRAKIKTMKVVSTTIEVDELDHATFEYHYLEQKGLAKGRANAANVIHSVDAYVLRSLLRRCSYDREAIETAHRCITVELVQRTNDIVPDLPEDHPFRTCIELYTGTGMVDPVVVQHLDETALKAAPGPMLYHLNGILARMLEHPSFHVVTVHDSFGCHPNHMDTVRYWYKEILAELSESTILSSIMSEIYSQPIAFTKLSHTLGKHIRNSNYALC